MSLIGIFKATAEAHPSRLAVTYYEGLHSSQTVTYKELLNEAVKVLKICKYKRDRSGTVISKRKQTDFPGNSNNHGVTSGTSKHFHIENCDALKETDVSSEVSKNALPPTFENSLDITTIGVICQPGLSSVACMLGIMHECAYFFLSPNWTKSEIESYVTRVSLKMILVEDVHLEKLKELPFEVVSSFDVFGVPFSFLYYVGDKVNSQQVKESEELAYIITTSGSTGTPKIVYVPHKCIIPNVIDFVRIYQTTGDDRVFCASPPTFDPSIVDIFVAFHAGASLVMVKQSLMKMPKLLLQILIKSKTTTLQATPSLLLSIVRSHKNFSLGNDLQLNVLALGGEMFPKLSAFKKWVDPKCKTKILNLYGITEVSCWASVCEVHVWPSITQNRYDNDSVNSSELNLEKECYSSREESASSECKSTGIYEDLYKELTPIGNPLGLTVVKLLNDVGEEVNENEEGEICIGSCQRVCLIDDSDIDGLCTKTSQSLLLDEAASLKENSEYTSISKAGNIHQNVTPNGDLILKRTGDKGIVKSGKIYCLGRFDRQIKRSGQKVSLLEIERQCERLSYVENCYVVSRNLKIIAFVQVDSSVTYTGTDVRDHLKLLLSDWKMPDKIIIFDSVPFNNHGKIDEEKLLLLESQSDSINKPGSFNSLSDKEFVVKAWIGLLGIFKINENDNFINVGGNSLYALQFVEAIEDYFAIKVPTLLDILLHKKFKDVLHLIMEAKKNKTKGLDSKKLQKGYKKRRVEVRYDLETNEYESREVNPVDREPPYSGANFLGDASRRGEELPYFSLPTSSPFLGVASRRGAVYNGVRLKIRVDQYIIRGVWKYNLKKCIDASPYVVRYKDGRKILLVGSHSHLFVCINYDTGTERWCIKLGDRIESSPCISYDGKHAYVGCRDHKLYCIDIQTGEIVWQFTAASEIKSSPVVDFDTGYVIFGSHDKNVYCLDSSGNKKWQVRVSYGSIFSSPCIVGQQVFAASLSGDIANIDKNNGSVNWKTCIYEPIFSSPASYSRGIVFGSAEGAVYGCSFRGEILWKFETKGPVFSSAFVSRLENGFEIIAIGCHDHCVYFFNKSGLNIASYEGESPIYAFPFIFHINLKTVLRIVVCETSGRCSVIQLDFRELGRGQYKKPLVDHYVLIQPGKTGDLYSSPVVFYDRLFICSRDNFVYGCKFY